MTILDKKFTKKYSIDGANRNVFLGKDKNQNLEFIDPIKNDFYLSTTEKKEYYVSQSGCTKAGKLISDYPLIEVGTYRIDADMKKNIQFGENCDGTSTFIYYPIYNINNAEKIQNQSTPIIISKNKDVALLYHPMSNTLEKYIVSSQIGNLFQEEEEYIKEIKLKWFDEYLNEQESIIKYKFIGRPIIDTSFNVDIVSFTTFNYHLNDTRWYEKQLDEKIKRFSGNYILDEFDIITVEKTMNDNQEKTFYCLLGKYREITKIFESIEEIYTFLGIEIHKDNKGIEYFFLWRKHTIAIQLVNDVSKGTQIAMSSDLERLLFPDEHFLNRGIEQLNKML